MARDPFGFGIQQKQIRDPRSMTQGLDRYDKSININAKDKGKEARDYLSKNIPYISNSLDNTEFEYELTNMFVKKHGLNKWKEVVDEVIDTYNPMNAYDINGQPMKVFGSSDFSDFIDDRFDIYKDLYGDK